MAVFLTGEEDGNAVAEGEAPKVFARREAVRPRAGERRFGLARCGGITGSATLLRASSRAKFDGGRDLDLSSHPLDGYELARAQRGVDSNHLMGGRRRQGVLVEVVEVEPRVDFFILRPKLRTPFPRSRADIMSWYLIF